MSSHPSACSTLSITFDERRAILRLKCTPPFMRAARVPGYEERHALVIVLVGIAHRRPVDHERVVQHRAVPVRHFFELFEKYGIRLT